jgi:hypothetical protein
VPVWTYEASYRPCKPRGSACVTLTAVQSISGVRSNSSAAQQSSPDARVHTAPPNNGGMSVRKLNPGRANEAAYCESCPSAWVRWEIVVGPTRAHRVSVKTTVWYMQAGASSDRYSGGRKICRWSFEEYYHNLREEVMHAFTPHVDVFLASNCIFRVRRLSMQH